MKAYIIPVLCAAVMLSSCAGGKNTANFDNALPEVGRLKLNTSETASEPQETEAVTETVTEAATETDTAEIPTEAGSTSETENLSETENVSGTTSEVTATEQNSAELQTTAVQTTSETQTTTVAATVTETQTTVSQTETETRTTTATRTAAVTAAGTEQKDFSGESPVKLIYGGKCVSLSEITDVKKFFGKPVSPEISAPSCLGEGEDIVYVYSDFTVSVFAPKGQSPMVVSVISTGKTIGNPKGVTVGASEKSALKAIGGDSLEENGTMISFFAEDGKITEVDYIILI